jgi:hypothetical protein
VELLSAAVPKLKNVSVLMNSANPANGFFFNAMSLRAETLGVRLDRIDVAAEGEMDSAIARAKGGALVVVTDPMFFRNRVHIVELTLRSRVPPIFGGREYVAAGGLMSYLSSNRGEKKSPAGAGLEAVSIRRRKLLLVPISAFVSAGYKSTARDWSAIWSAIAGEQSPIVPACVPTLRSAPLRCV